MFSYQLRSVVGGDENVLDGVGGGCHFSRHQEWSVPTACLSHRAMPLLTKKRKTCTPCDAFVPPLICVVNEQIAKHTRSCPMVGWRRNCAQMSYLPTRADYGRVVPALQISIPASQQPLAFPLPQRTIVEDCSTVNVRCKHLISLHPSPARREWFGPRLQEVSQETGRSGWFTVLT